MFSSLQSHLLNLFLRPFQIQSYDCRADRWVFAPDDDPDGPLAYHGAATVGHKIYVIGGFDGENYFNTCRVYNTLNRSWHEVYLEEEELLHLLLRNNMFRYRQCIRDGVTCP